MSFGYFGLQVESLVTTICDTTSVAEFKLKVSKTVFLNSAYIMNCIYVFFLTTNKYSIHNPSLFPLCFLLVLDAADLSFVLSIINFTHSNLIIRSVDFGYMCWGSWLKKLALYLPQVLLLLVWMRVLKHLLRMAQFLHNL